MSEAEKKPLISPQAEIYLRDVEDHVDDILSSLELFSGQASNVSISQEYCNNKGLIIQIL
jgi:hypothetical protein